MPMVCTETLSSQNDIKKWQCKTGCGMRLRTGLRCEKTLKGVCIWNDYHLIQCSSARVTYRLSFSFPHTGDNHTH